MFYCGVDQLELTDFVRLIGSATNLEWQVNLGIDDYRRKETKKAEPQ